MKTLQWDLILGVLGLIFAIVPWFWPEGAMEAKAAATIAIVWLTLTIYLIISNHLNVAWPLFSGGLVLVVAILGYSQLLVLQPPQTSRTIILGLALSFLLGIFIILASRESQSLPFRASVFLAQLDSLEQFEPFVEDAKEIFLCGLTLGGLVSRYGSTIERLVRNQGCRLRVILPQEDVIRSSAYRISLDYKTPTSLQEEYLRSLDWLDQLAAHSMGNQVQIRITETLPTISLLIANPGSPKARLRVSLHVFGGALNKRPYFEFSRHKHPKWYEFFAQKYCSKLWERSVPREVGAKAELKRAGQRLQHMYKK